MQAFWSVLFPLSLGYNNWDATVADMMDIGPLCYTYAKLY
jgi:hypothetical protein